jgi:drug/metabolite transporter (DMT)-like permease
LDEFFPMRSLLLVLSFVVLTFLSWGLYGPVLHQGQRLLGDGVHPSSLRPFICVGIAYFLIAVVVPLLALRAKGEKGNWTVMGAVWSFLGGAAGAMGALGIVLAFKFHGSPVYVMPLVFGLAPVVNTFVTMWMSQTFKEANSLFFAGVILVAVGTAGVLTFKPSHAAHPPIDAAAAEAEAAPAEKPPVMRNQASTKEKLALIPLSIALAALCWGSYGPILHKGQMKMAGSRLRPFLCVGLAYFVIAVLLPLPLVQFFPEPGGFNFSGVAWSLAGGAAGAVGALGIIMAFNFGGKPIYVMPLVFGGAPMVNTFTTVAAEGTYSALSPLFLASLMVVIAGAATVLVFAPRHAKPAAEPAPSEDNEDTLPADAPRPDDAPSDSDYGSGEMSGEDQEDTIDREETIQERPEA